MKETEETKEHRQRHATYRLIIIFVVVMVGMGGLIYMYPEQVKDQGLDFTYVGARVEWSDQNNISISFTNNSSQCTAKVIGINEEGKEVELRSSNLCSENITFNLTQMLEDEMEIWIEIENIGESIKEKQKLELGE